LDLLGLPDQRDALRAVLRFAGDFFFVVCFSATPFDILGALAFGVFTVRFVVFLIDLGVDLAAIAHGPVQ
jgi:hypothetical protein